MTTAKQLFGILLSRLVGDVGLPIDLTWLPRETEQYCIEQIAKVIEEAKRKGAEMHHAGTE